MTHDAGDAGDAAPRDDAGDSGLEDGAAPDSSAEWCPATSAPGTFTWPTLATAQPSPDVDTDDAGIELVPTPVLTAGPIVGATSERDAKLWLRADQPAHASVVFWPFDEPSRTESVTTRLDAATSFDGVTRLDGLSPSTRYGYRVELAATQSADAATVAMGDFKTLPATGVPGRLRFAVGADIAGGGAQPIFQQIGEVAPDFLLLIGDQVYADTVEPTFEGYAAKYLNNWNIPYFVEMLRVIPTLMIWDDHDIVDNYFAGKSARYEPARAAYDIYAQSHNPDPLRDDELHYTFEAGEVGFFVLDVRSHRSNNADPDGPEKTMLGAQQKADLLQWLECSTSRIKIIVSPVVFSRWARTGRDSWNGYATERAEILDFIVSHGIEDVLLITGDQHWSAVFDTTRDGYRFIELLPTPLSKERSTAPTFDTPEILARDDDNFVFGVVDIDTSVDPASIALMLCAEGKPCDPGAEPAPGTSLDVEGERENVPFTLQLTTADLGAE